MRQISSVPDFQNWRRGISGTLGFVPTMGTLHEGHLSLVKESVNSSDNTVVSIFVNPTQFGPGEDLAAYPRNLDKDLFALRELDVSVVFLPSEMEMYTPGHSTYVQEEGVSIGLEGNSRPLHFRGVTTIVAKLFNLVQPSSAYFGRKDAQQLRVIRKMVDDLNYNIKIVDCPTVRNKNGLALSSRNEYLTPDERQRATIIYSSLLAGKALFDSGERDANLIRNTIEAGIREEPLAKVDYVSVADDKFLTELSDEIPADALVSVAVFFGKTRLIDNITLHQ